MISSTKIFSVKKPHYAYCDSSFHKFMMELSFWIFKAGVAIMTLLGVFIELTVTMLSPNRKISREMEQEGSGVILNLTAMLHHLKLIRIQYVHTVLCHVIYSSTLKKRPILWN